MSKINNIGIFCGASPHVSQHFLDEAYKVGRLLAQNNYTIVYGGNRYGTMGAVADGALSVSGKVIGVFPQSIGEISAHEVRHPNLSKLIDVPDMHSRKMTMFNLADAFITLPGGFGTMDETFEIITWKALKVHNKPIIIYNYDNYYEHFTKLAQRFVNTGFSNKSVIDLYYVTQNINEILDKVNIIEPCMEQA